jgi:glycopeptide antibiotics resistance protein
MLREFYYQFLPYRSYAYPFLTASLIVAPCWLVFRAYRLRTSGSSLSLAREILLLIFVIYLSGLAVATLSLNHNSRSVADAMVGVELRPNLATLTCFAANARGFCMHNAKGNVMLFLPFGILILLVWRRLGFWSGMLIATALSVSIELLQYFSRAFGSNRAVDVNDVILNVLGASLGLLFMSLLRLGRRNRSTVPRA